MLRTVQTSVIELEAADGHRLAAYRAAPAGVARGAIVVIQEIFGVNNHIRAVTNGWARDGYLAIAPAMFDRVERGVELDYTRAGINRGRAIRSKIPVETAAMADVRAAVAAVSDAGKVGIVGYCWGGLVTWMAAALVDGLACAVAYYGGGILDHDDLHPRCPVLAHFGERDEMLPVDRVKMFAARHAAHGGEVHLYRADHGFNCDERGSYDAAAATLARERTLGFFRARVG